MKDAIGSVIHCAEKAGASRAAPSDRSDLVPLAEIQEFNARIDRTIKSVPWIVDSLFFGNLAKAKNASGEQPFTLADFDNFLKKFERRVCGDALYTYKKVRAGLARQQNDISPSEMREAIDKARAELVFRCQ